MTQSKKDQLFVFYNHQKVGIVFKNPQENTLHFSYETSWVNSTEGFALSPHLPLIKDHKYGNVATRSYFENLLPEGSARDRINSHYRDVTKDTFRFLQEFGEDCAGAFTTSSDLNFLSAMDPHEATEVTLEELDSQIEKDQDLGTFFHKQKKARFSLAGAQDKIAVIYYENKLYVPTKGGATTHVLKPLIKKFNKDFSTVINEHFCMELAQRVGLTIPKSLIIIKKYPYYLVERYDRQINSAGIVERLHQFDLCQGQGILATQKYEDDGGPTLDRNYLFIKNTSAAPAKDLEAYLKWITFNLIIGNNDSHSKNISFLRQGSQLRLSPFYDLLSTDLYPGISKRFAFGFGKKGQEQYYWYKLKKHHLENASLRLGAQKYALRTVLLKMCSQIDTHKDELIKNMEQQFKYSFSKLEKNLQKRLNYLQKL